jgi:hypothetical protein
VFIFVLDPDELVDLPFDFPDLLLDFLLDLSLDLSSLLELESLWPAIVYEMKACLLFTFGNQKVVGGRHQDRIRKLRT